jgi:hypothetical protein
MPVVVFSSFCWLRPSYIAKAIGPQDVLVTLLNNLRVQERVNRVCTTVASAIVAETCSPFTILPALMNEYRVPELNVQVRRGHCVVFWFRLFVGVLVCLFDLFLMRLLIELFVNL